MESLTTPRLVLEPQETKHANLLFELFQDPELYPREAYLAYTTFRPSWKMGYAKEGCQAVIDHLFSDWGVTKIRIEMDTRNQASIRLAEALGAKRVGMKLKAQFLKGSWSDEYAYELQL